MTLTEKTYSSDWIEVKLKDILLPFQTLDPQNTPEATFTYIDIGSINNKLNIIEEPKNFLGKDAPSRARRLVQKGDVLFSTVRPYLKNICSVPDEFDNCLTSTGICILRPSQNIDPKFLFLSVIRDIFVKQISGDMDGTLYPAVRDNDIYETFISIPPLNEQRRIVAKIDALFARSHRAREYLASIPPLLEKFRQSVLAAAFRGDLTKEWREKNKDVESVDNHLQNLTREDTFELDEESVNTNSFSDNLDFSEYKLNQLPDFWEWVNIGLIGKVKGGKRLPKGKSLVNFDTGQPYIKAGNLKKGTVLTEDLQFLPLHLKETLKNYTVVAGDVYITIVGACIGDAGVIPEMFHGANLTENAAKICNLVGCNSDFLALWLRSPICQKIIKSNTLSAAQGKLALFRIAQIPIPLAPLAEQKEVIKQIERLMKIIDMAESYYEKALVDIDSLDQSILTKAFRGELVPQDPNDEPASVLLERIKAERAASETAKAKPKTKQTKGETKQEEKVVERVRSQESEQAKTEREESTTNTAHETNTANEANEANKEESGRAMVQLSLFE